ncbi:TonB family protein [Massilia antarctica]|uniref:TonB family protein n=1 Tax=Massilia antarctica TaxID=2765360 RepID=A0AA48WG52_9BURK|nr:TonB family protein [Massilia antarctica]QPI50620.1 TonB family protein [Massilia antarctica]
MKHLQNLSSLSIAVAVSVTVHAALLAVRFVAPEAFALTPADPGLEVILVNAKHANKPLKADALAQANLDGGGNAENGRAASPLPDMHKNETGESVKSTLRRITELEQMQQNLLTKTRDSSLKASPVTEKEKPDPDRDGTDLIESTKPLARKTAEIAQRIEDQNKRPRKTYITPSTQAVGYAIYYKTMQKRVEDIGTLNFPQREGKKLYGELTVYIPIFQDGSIYQKDGGVRIEKSSGNPALDKAALAIVRRAAPFGAFPKNMLSSDKDDLWVIITRFKFTHDDKLEAELRGDGR